ncbi:hypothetical protein JNUCC0626_41930 [Lentzea sp. JNUCC 0626]
MHHSENEPGDVTTIRASAPSSSLRRLSFQGSETSSPEPGAV